MERALSGGLGDPEYWEAVLKRLQVSVALGALFGVVGLSRHFQQAIGDTRMHTRTSCPVRPQVQCIVLAATAPLISRAAPRLPACPRLPPGAQGQGPGAGAAGGLHAAPHQRRDHQARAGARGAQAAGGGAAAAGAGV